MAFDDVVGGPDFTADSVLDRVARGVMPDVGENANGDMILNRLNRKLSQPRDKEESKPVKKGAPDFSDQGTPIGKLPDFSDQGTLLGTDPMMSDIGGGMTTAVSGPPEPSTLQSVHTSIDPWVAAKSVAAGAANSTGGVLQGIGTAAANSQTTPVVAEAGLGNDMLNSPWAVPGAANPEGLTPKQPVDQNALVQAGMAIKGVAPKLTPEESDTVLSRVGQMGGAILPYAVLAAVNPLAGMGLGAVGMAADSYGSVYEDAKKHGASDEIADKAATRSALVSGVLGAAPLGAGKYAQSLIAKVVSSSAAFATAGEAQEAILEQIKKDYDPKAGYTFDQKRLIAELILGAGMGGLHHAFDSRNQQAQQPQQPNAGAIPPGAQPGASPGGSNANNGPNPNGWPGGTGSWGSPGGGAGPQPGGPGGGPHTAGQTHNANPGAGPQPNGGAGPQPGPQPGPGKPPPGSGSGMGPEFTMDSRMRAKMEKILRTYDPNADVAGMADHELYNAVNEHLRDTSKTGYTAKGDTEQEKAQREQHQTKQAEDAELKGAFQWMTDAQIAAMTPEMRAVWVARARGPKPGAAGPEATKSEENAQNNKSEQSEQNPNTGAATSESDVATGTREAPIKAKTADDVLAAKPVEPKSEAQASAENYQHAHVELEQFGLTGSRSISIETGVGQERKGVDASGKPWSVTMTHGAYGRIKGTKGADGQPLDIFVGPHPSSPHIFVVDQHDPATGEFDEHKILAGYRTPIDALHAYAHSYNDAGKDRIGHVTAMGPAEFNAWLKGDTTKPLKGSPASTTHSGVEAGSSSTEAPGGVPKGAPATTARAAGPGATINHSQESSARQQTDDGNKPVSHVRPRTMNDERPPMTLMQFIASKGGIKPSPELKALDLDGKKRVHIPGRKGFFQVVRDDGHEHDIMRRMAQEENFFPRDNEGTSPDRTLTEFYDSLDEELNRDNPRRAEGQELEQTTTQKKLAAEREAHEKLRDEEAYGEARAAIAKDYADIPTDLRDLAAKIMADEGETNVDNAIDTAALRLAGTDSDYGVTEHEFDGIFGKGDFDEVRAEAVSRDGGPPAPEGNGEPEAGESQEDRGTGERVSAAGKEGGKDQKPERDHAAGKNADTEREAAGSGAATEAGHQPAAGAPDKSEAAVEKGADNKEQTVLPGAEKIGQGEQAQRAINRPLKPKVAQKPADEGLFGDEKDQGDLLDQMSRKVPEEAANLEALKKQLVVIASGMSRAKEFGAGTFAWGGYQNRGIGVDVGELSDSALDLLAKRAVDLKAQIFVDSGAFSTFRHNLREQAKADAEAMDLFGSDRPATFRSMDFDKIMARYDQLEEAYAKHNEAEDTSVPPPMLVMPDIVGDQRASLDLVAKYKDYIAAEAAFNVSKPIVPIQRGELSLAEAYREIVKTLGTDKFIVGVPSNEKAVPPAELRDFINDVKPRRIHFLGAVNPKNIDAKLKIVADANYPVEHISADANILRSALYGKYSGDRSQAIADLLHARRPIADEPKEPTIKAEDDSDGISPPVHGRDAGPEPEAVPPSEGQRGVGPAGEPESAGSPPADESDHGRQAQDLAEPEGSRGTGAGDDVRVSGRHGEPEEGRADRAVQREARAVKGENYRIEPGALGEERGPKAKATDNIAAIKLANRLVAEDRPATAGEQHQLARYVGWGGLKNAFPDADGNIAKGFERVAADLKETLTPEEYDTARRSIQYAHYTAEDVINGMWDIAERLGFKGGHVFEPGMGVGHFAGLMPGDMAEHSIYNGVEMDHVTARIAKLLYPKWGVRQADFTKMPLAENTFDLAIGNPPFADITIQSDPKYAKDKFLLHDYFFAKSLDGVRPGGLMAFVTSAGTMNKLNPSARNYLADRAEFVGGIRLPSNAFKQNAGTEVTTDILMFRKRMPDETPGDRTWTETAEVTLPGPDGKPTKGKISRYFAEHPEMVLGKPDFANKLYLGDYSVKAWDNFDLKAALAVAIAKLPRNVMVDAETPRAKAEADFEGTEKKDGSYYLKDGRLMQQRGGAGYEVERRGKGVEGGKTQAEIERISALIPIRDALRETFAADLADDAAGGKRARTKLNKAYDDFVAKFGPINRAEIQRRRPNAIQEEAARAEAREEARYAGGDFDEGSFDPTSMIAMGKSLTEVARARKAAREAQGDKYTEGGFDPAEMPDVIIDKRPNIDPFIDDQESYRLRALEEYDEPTNKAQKKDVFFKNVISKDKPPEIKNINDAVLHVLNQKGSLDIDAIGSLVGKSRTEAIEELGERIYQVPGAAETWETREKYLSGNVRKKLALAKAAAAKNPVYRRNVEALQAAQPAPLAPSQIGASLGMPWLPPEVISQFGTEALGLEKLRAHYTPSLASWSVSGDTDSMAAVTTWGTSRRNATALLNDALNRQNPKIYDAHDDGSRTLNVVATQAANEKMQAIRDKFSEWIFADEKRADRLANMYNEDYNNLVTQEYNGDYLTTPGIASNWSWRPHQTRVIARIIQSGNTYMAHAVGAGKTSAMIGAGMEMRRLGLAKKPAYAVPNHMLAQFTKEFYEQYPTARIMVADERQFHTDRRKQFMANVALSDLDAVIMTHSSFGMIPVSDEFSDSVIQEEMDEYRRALADMPKDQDNRITRSRIEKQLERLEQRLSGRSNRKRDSVFNFDEMGIDFLFVDEAHLFRKLDFSTQMSNLKGITPQGSGMAWDLYVKSKLLEKRNPGRSLVLASGTPVTNTMAELFTVSRYLQPNELNERQLHRFDAWAGAFGENVSELEQDAAGGYKQVSRFAKFVNVAELSSMVRQVMDVVTSRQLEQYVVRPKLKGGKRIMNLADKSPALDRYQASLAARMKAMQGRGKPKPGDDIMLKVIGDGRHAAIDMRLVGADKADANHPSKLDLLVENVARIHKATKAQKFYRPKNGAYDMSAPADVGPATQMIFANLGISGSRGFSVPDYIRSELVRRGVPRAEIAMIADYKSHVAKQKLFNDMNEGKVRVLIGSTAKMATGVNAQRRLYAIHNQDPLWFPSDDEQRNGRGLRQGNMNPEIEIHDYSTKGTYDSTMWGMMEKKARFIQGFFEGDPSLRSMDDLGEASQYEQAKALTTNDPRLMRLTELRQELEKANRRKAAFDNEQYAVRRRRVEAKSDIEHFGAREIGIEKDIAQREVLTGDNFKAKIGRQSYDKRVDFGEALLAVLDKIATKENSGRHMPVGEISGFALVATPQHIVDHMAVNLDMKRNGGAESHITVGTSGLGAVRSMESVLSGFDSDLAAVRRHIATAEKFLKDSAGQGDKKFTGDTDMAKLAGEIAALQAELSAKKEEPTEPAPTEPEGVEPTEPRDRSVTLGSFGDPAKVVATFKAFWTSNFQPELVSDRALTADPLFAKYKSAQAHEKDALIRQSEGEWNYWNKRGDAERIRFLDDIETAAFGAVPPDPVQARMAKRYRTMLDANWALEKQFGSQASFVEDYFPHIWEKPDAWRAFSQARSAQMGPTWFQKKRTIDYITDGLAAGLKLKYTNPVDIVVHRLLSGVDMRQRMQLLFDLKDQGLAWEGVQGGAQLVSRGWTAINAPDRKQWVIHPDVQLLWKNGLEAQGFWQAEHLGGSIFRGWMSLKNAWIPVKLAMSAFHPLHVLHINYSNGMAMGWEQVVKNRDPIAALKAVANGFVGPLIAAPGATTGAAVGALLGSAAGMPVWGGILGSMAGAATFGAAKRAGIVSDPYHPGKEARKAWSTRPTQQTPEQKALVALMNDGGFVPQLSEQMKIGAKRNLAVAWQKILRKEAGPGDWLRAVSSSMRRAIEVLQAPIFEQWIPSLKTAAYLQQAAALLKRRPELLTYHNDRRVALRAIAKSIDNRFGEMFYGNLFWNRYLKDSAIATFLSIGWNLGFVREFGGAMFETVSRPLGLLPPLKPGAPRKNIREASNKIAFAIAYMGSSALILGIMSMLMGDDHKPPEGLDFIFPRIGGVNPDGSPRRITNMSYIREIPMALKHIQERGGNILTGIGEMVYNKMLFEPFHELMNNRTYYGYNIWDENAPVYKQVWQAVKHTLGNETSPMAISGAKHAAALSGKEFPSLREAMANPDKLIGALRAKGVDMSMLGFGPAPSYVEKSGIQNRINYLYGQHVAAVARPQADEENSQEKLAVRMAIMIAKRDRDSNMMAEARERGRAIGLSPKYMADLGKTPTDVYLFSRLPNDDQQSLLRNASDEERQRYLPHAHMKVRTTINRERYAPKE